MSQDYNGMYLSSLEDNLKLDPGYVKLAKENKKNIPHYSILKEVDVRRQILRDGKAWFFKDNVGNSIVYGYYKGASDGNSSPLKVMLDTGVIKQTNYLAFRDREKGNGWLEKTADKLFSWDIGGLDFAKKVGLSPNTTWYNALEQIEKKGQKHKDPILLIVRDVNIVSLKSVFNKLAPYLTVILSVAATFVFPALGIYAASGLGASLKAGLDAVINGKAPLEALVNIAKPFAGTIADSVGLGEYYKEFENIKGQANEKINELKSAVPPDIIKYSEKGAELFNSYKNGDYDAVLGLSGLGTLSGLSDPADIEKGLDIANNIWESFVNGDIDGIVKNTEMAKEEAEKVSLSFQQQNTIDKFAKMPADTQVAEPFGLPELQTFVLTAYSSLLLRGDKTLQGISSLIPNCTLAMKLITDRIYLSPVELKALVNIFQNEYANAVELKRLLTLSILAQAKQYENTDKPYYLPSNIPPEVQVEIGWQIKNRLNVDVKAVNPKVEMALSNAKEFI